MEILLFPSVIKSITISYICVFGVFACGVSADVMGVPVYTPNNKGSNQIVLETTSIVEASYVVAWDNIKYSES